MTACYSTIANTQQQAFLIGECSLGGYECTSTMVYPFSSAFYWWTATTTVNAYQHDAHISLIRPNGSYYGGHQAYIPTWNTQPIKQRPALDCISKYLCIHIDNVYNKEAQAKRFICMI